MDLTLPKRPSKPRSSGRTCLTDTGSTLIQVDAMLQDFGAYVDVAKLGVGSAYVTPRLGEKIALYQEHDVDVYFGGTLTEKAIVQNKFDALMDYIESMNVTSIEISSGSADIHHDQVLTLIEKAKSRFTVYTEIGSKDADQIMAPSQWIARLKEALDAGSSFVICEGRDSGTAGIFRKSGELRTGLVADIGAQLPPEKLIWEAPTQSSQMHMIMAFGTNVNLGNIKPEDVLILEAERVGLRYETFELEA